MWPAFRYVAVYAAFFWAISMEKLICWNIDFILTKAFGEFPSRSVTVIWAFSWQGRPVTLTFNHAFVPCEGSLMIISLYLIASSAILRAVGDKARSLSIVIR